jgi:glycosyltransferase involved in cell wall biosynthesis
MDKRDVCVVVPAYNESRQIATTVSDLRAAFQTVIVVDDGSADDTGTVAAAAGAVVLRHAVNRGQGAALQTGFSYALSLESMSYCVTFDADGQHRVDDAVQMVGAAKRQGVDVVLASRFLGHAEDIPDSRRLLLRCALRFSRLTTGLALTDTHNGLRVLSRLALSSIRLRHDGMAYATELENSIGRHGLTWIEVPTTVMYTEYSLSKGQRNSNAINILFDLAVERIRQPR